MPASVNQGVVGEHLLRLLHRCRALISKIRGVFFDAGAHHPIHPFTRADGIYRGLSPFSI